MTIAIATATAAPVLHGGGTVGPFPHWAALILAVAVLWIAVAGGVRVADAALARLGW